MSDQDNSSHHSVSPHSSDTEESLPLEEGVPGILKRL